MASIAPSFIVVVSFMKFLIWRRVESWSGLERFQKILVQNEYVSFWLHVRWRNSDGRLEGFLIKMETLDDTITD